MDNVFNELEYLSNPSLYKKYVTQQNIQNDDDLINDKKFYRKRVIQLTKDLYTNDIDKYNVPLIDVKRLFNKYIKECIDVLKLIDTNDQHQDEYIDLSSNKINITDDISFNLIDNDSMLFNKPITTNKIEDCIPLIKKSNKIEKDMKIPVKKNLNLKDPKLKTKGVKKKE
jgi:hypothetical protein